jgi:hypothetical protein
MRHHRIAKRAHDVQQCVGVAIRHHIEQRHSFAARGRHVCELHRRGGPLFRLEHCGQLIEPCVRNARHADVCLGLAVRTGGFPSAREQLKEGGLSGRGESD